MLETARFGNIGNWQTPSCGSESLYFYEWAERPVILSEGYFMENLPESSKFEDGPALIQDVMRGLDSMFLHEFSEANHEYLAADGFRSHLLDRFKDPGLLHHIVFWDFIKDPTAVIFEWHHFRGNGKLCLEMLHGQRYDIFGRPRLPNAIGGPWERLIGLYHAESNSRRHSEYGHKLFSEVLGWPLS